MAITTWEPAAETFRSLLPLKDRIRYVAWVLTGRKSTIDLSFKSGPKFSFRSKSKLANDPGVAYEIFMLDMYRPARSLDRNAVRHIVDLGGNSGFSMLQFLQIFPGARVTVLEPHPEHAKALRRNLELNGWGSRVNVVEAAAGTAPGKATLSDEGSSSSLGASKGIDVGVVDVFEILLKDKIDVLKIDIEGSEHALLADPRFDRIQAQSILMEWHVTDAVPDARRICMDKLVSMGYLVDESFTEAHAGMLYGRRS